MDKCALHLKAVLKINLTTEGCRVDNTILHRRKYEQKISCGPCIFDSRL